MAHHNGRLVMHYSSSHDVLGILLDWAKQGNEYKTLICLRLNLFCSGTVPRFIFYATIDINVMIKWIAYYVFRLQDNIMWVVGRCTISRTIRSCVFVWVPPFNVSDLWFGVKQFSLLLESNMLTRKYNFETLHVSLLLFQAKLEAFLY